jgi:hypothetical protein
MRKTACFVTTLLLVFFVISCMGKEVSVAAERGGPAAEAKERFEKAKQEYMRLKNEGRDVSEAAILIPSLRGAIQAKDYAEADKLLLKIEASLAEVGGEGVGAAPVFAKAHEPVAISPHFGFGVEYAEPGLASVYKAVGANWAKIPLVDWGRVEPNPPRNGVHTYEWKKLDGVIAEYQSQGFDLLIVLKSRSKWGSLPIPRSHKGKTGYPSTPPKPEHWADYSRFVYSMVERYDNDGVDDMPGLRMPVRAYEVESEAQHRLFWQGTFEDYAKLLKATYKAAKKADPNTTIVLSGINLIDVFDDMSGPEQIERRINELPPHKRAFPRESLAFIKKALTLDEYFDEIEFHYVNNYKGAYGQVEFIRSAMRRKGYDKPIWAGDAAAAPFLVPGAYTFNPIMPKEQAERLYKRLGDRKDPNHRQTVDWYFDEQAKNIVKKFVVGMEVGLEGIMMGNTKDWIGYGLPNFVYQGLIDHKKKPRPAFLAYKTTISKLKGYDTIQRLEYGDGVFAYLFTGKGKKPMRVAWADGQSVTIGIGTDAKTVTLTQPPTLLEQKAPHIEKLTPQNGVAKVKLDSVPVFIEES